ncbi:HN1_G0037800.mRNA.1.CDS.1 [Saccharomyces cerevisiae]|nr:HN1_G0037800.mRNA.1.CDS.1 [Saccharomyces cerevisiae]CAI4743440.1 BAL_1a_G0048700.mRNA.1.CDS.1 [Saccharomyces cerevisiae]CAI7332339.1 BAL_1a_G0048700.mRNA.1.CDS.1 [Saccharomyces cerevisiae]
MAKSVFNFFHFKILEYLNRFVYHSQYFLPYYCSLEVPGKRAEKIGHFNIGAYTLLLTRR